MVRGAMLRLAMIYGCVLAALAAGTIQAPTSRSCAGPRATRGHGLTGPTQKFSGIPEQLVLEAGAVERLRGGTPDDHIPYSFQVALDKKRDDADVYVVGSTEALGSWTYANASPMTKTKVKGQEVYQKEVHVPRGQQLEYKFMMVSRADHAETWETIANRHLLVDPESAGGVINTKFDNPTVKMETLTAEKLVAAAIKEAKLASKAKPPVRVAPPAPPAAANNAPDSRAASPESSSLPEALIGGAVGALQSATGGAVCAVTSAVSMGADKIGPLAGAIKSTGDAAGNHIRTHSVGSVSSVLRAAGAAGTFVSARARAGARAIAGAAGAVRGAAGAVRSVASGKGAEALGAGAAALQAVGAGVGGAAGAVRTRTGAVCAGAAGAVVGVTEGVRGAVVQGGSGAAGAVVRCAGGAARGVRGAACAAGGAVRSGLARLGAFASAGLPKVSVRAMVRAAAGRAGSAFPALGAACRAAGGVAGAAVAHAKDSGRALVQRMEQERLEGTLRSRIGAIGGLSLAALALLQTAHSAAPAVAAASGKKPAGKAVPKAKKEAAKKGKDAGASWVPVLAHKGKVSKEAKKAQEIWAPVPRVLTPKKETKKEGWVPVLASKKNEAKKESWAPVPRVLTPKKETKKEGWVPALASKSNEARKAPSGKKGGKEGEGWTPALFSAGSVSAWSVMISGLVSGVSKQEQVQGAITAKTLGGVTAGSVLVGGALRSASSATKRLVQGGQQSSFRTGAPAMGAMRSGAAHTPGSGVSGFVRGGMGGVRGAVRAAAQQSMHYLEQCNARMRRGVATSYLDSLEARRATGSRASTYLEQLEATRTAAGSTRAAANAVEQRTAAIVAETRMAQNAAKGYGELAVGRQAARGGFRSSLRGLFSRGVKDNLKRLARLVLRLRFKA